MEDIRLLSSPADSYRTTKLFEHLCSLPHPRAARFTDFGRVFWVVLISGWVLLAALSARTDYALIKSKSFDLNSAMWNVIFPIIGGLALAAILRTESKNRKLLEDGCLALGTVLTRQRTGRKRRISEITYQFKNAAGEQYHRKSQDHTHSYFPGMLVPVFYDPVDSSRAVAICSTYLLVVGKDGRVSPQS
jgi:hypothetical protein